MLEGERPRKKGGTKRGLGKYLRDRIVTQTMSGEHETIGG